MDLSSILTSGSCNIPYVLEPSTNSRLDFENNNTTEPKNPRNGLPLYGHVPGSTTKYNPGTTYDEVQQWFKTPSDFEYQHQSRGFYHYENIPEDLKILFTNEKIKHFNKTAERLIIQRCLPAPYSKEVGWTYPLYVGSMDDHTWSHWIASHVDPPTYVKGYTRKYPDHDGKKIPVFFSCVGWESGKFPTLVTPHWYFTKWCENEWRIHRAAVNSVFFIHNRYSEIVRVKFTYNTQQFNVLTNMWEYC